MYKANKVIKGFEINTKNKKILKCRRGKTPFKNDYYESIGTMKAYFSKYDCDDCRDKNRCIQKRYNETYTVVSIKLDEANNEIREYVEKIKKDTQYIKKLYSTGYIMYPQYISMIYELTCKIVVITKQIQSDKLYDYIIQLSRIVIDAPLNGFTGGAYVNLAYAKLYKLIKRLSAGNGFIDSRKKIIDKEIEECYIQALQIKRTNNLALNGLSMYYYYIEEYDKSIHYFKGISDKNIMIEYIKLVAQPITNYQLYKVNNSINKKKLNNLLDFYKKLYDEIQYDNALKVFIGLIYSDCAILVGDELTTFTIMTEILKRCPHSIIEGNEMEIYSRLASVYMGKNFNRPKEAVEYYNKISDYDMSQSEHKRLFENNMSNMALCYLKLKEYNKVIEVINAKKEYCIDLNNTDYHNLAAAYLKLEDFNNAVFNINMALYMYEDETSLRLASEIYRKRGNHKEAIKFAEKALYFLENNDSDIYALKGDVRMISDITVDVNDFFITMYKNLSMCYLFGKKYENAYAINEIALQKYPDEDEFKDNLEIAKQFIDISKKNDIVEANLRRLEAEKAEFKNQIHTTRRWIVGLVNYQNLIKSKDIDENSWSAFESKIEEIIEEMKSEANKSNVKYEDICRKLNDRFEFLSKQALSFITTAEYLYQHNKNNFIDFAPIVVEFSKVFEVELNRLLKTKRDRTLGEILHDKSIRDSMELAHLLDNIEEIVEIRNCSAHTGQCTIEKLEVLRNKIYEQNLLEQIFELMK